MKHKLLVTLTTACLLSGCMNTDWRSIAGDDTEKNTPANGAENGEVVYIETARMDMLGEKSSKQLGNTFVDDTHFQAQSMGAGQGEANIVGANWQHGYKEPVVKNINHFVRGIMHNLVNNIHYVNDKTPIGVASFIFLDRSFAKSTLLGNQIAESFMHEVHQFGIPVIDFKTTDFLRVTDQGDFVFSRDFLELEDELPIKYVLAGTLVKHQSGYLVNARIIGLTSKAIVASAQGFIPNDIAEAIMPSQHTDGIMLMQGE